MQLTSLILALALAASPAAPDPCAERAGPVDLNTATAAELTGVPGIGPKRAERIVAERARRPFRAVSDLRRVPGIGKKTLARLRPHLVVRPPSKPGPAVTE
jgi:competence protein ComEA